MKLFAGRETFADLGLHLHLTITDLLFFGSWRLRKSAAFGVVGLARGGWTRLEEETPLRAVGLERGAVRWEVALA